MTLQELYAKIGGDYEKALTDNAAELTISEKVMSSISG